MKYTRHPVSSAVGAGVSDAVGGGGGGNACQLPQALPQRPTPPPYRPMDCLLCIHPTPPLRWMPVTSDLHQHLGDQLVRSWFPSFPQLHALPPPPPTPPQHWTPAFTEQHPTHVAAGGVLWAILGTCGGLWGGARGGARQCGGVWGGAR